MSNIGRMCLNLQAKRNVILESDLKVLKQGVHLPKCTSPSRNAFIKRPPYSAAIFYSELNVTA